ncbi:head morphogenesis protein [Klebsiella phage vB_KpnS-Carvaje]|uniref:Head morphogenesis protein n=1 Tax=Klebsiella phage vB_KpnS-Carvaje TaxID=2900314 RepID=A0AAE8ZEC9_9CAUD|nr:head morphogenesis [Klebsiella phage vB_KpnS-Carvaje]UJQ43995.1 head morphogenesis protein [Klebsiella phage vB_KpnS-Carvaje]
MKDPYPDIADKYDLRIREALNLVWENVRRSESLANLEYIIETQGISGLLPILDTLPDELSAQLRPVIENAIAESGRVVVQVLPKAAVTAPVVFSLVNPRVGAYINNYVGQMIREVSDETVKAVQIAVNQGIVTGRNPRQIARDFRSSIGLTSRQEQTVQRLRAALEKGEAGYVNSLTTVTDSTKNAVSAGKLSESQIDKIVEQTRLRYVKQRTETIARTESLRATSVGQDLAIREGQITGAISNELLKRWLYRHDTRTRDAHISAGETNGWIPMNRPFSTPLGPLMFPRDPNGSASNTINCRCRVQYSLPEDIGSLG